MTEPIITPTGFPELFTFTLRDILAENVEADYFGSRPVRENDPAKSVLVFEGEATPTEYQIGGQYNPSLMQWEAFIQVYAKAANVVDGRNLRRVLMRDCRKALFLPSTVQALNVLVDDYERVSSFRLRRLDFVPVEARDAKGQFHFLGQIHLTFDTERI